MHRLDKSSFFSKIVGRNVPISGFGREAWPGYGRKHIIEKRSIKHEDFTKSTFIVNLGHASYKLTRSTNKI